MLGSVARSNHFHGDAVLGRKIAPKLPKVDVVFEPRPLGPVDVLKVPSMGRA